MGGVLVAGYPVVIDVEKTLSKLCEAVKLGAREIFRSGYNGTRPYNTVPGNGVCEPFAQMCCMENL